MGDDLTDQEFFDLIQSDPTRDETPRCLQEGPDCKGEVEYHMNPDRDDFKSFPRCEHHQELRLQSAEKNRELMSDVAPSWFDPAYAGERWDEDY